MQNELRQLTPDYSEHLTYLHKRSFDDSWTKEAFSFFLSLPVVTGWIHFSKGTSTGFVLCRVIGHESEILTLCVDPLYRRKGIAMQLMKKVFTLSRRVLVDVSVTNEAAIALYSKLGFKKINERAQYYPNGDNAVVMELTA